MAEPYTETASTSRAKTTPDGAVKSAAPLLKTSGPATPARRPIELITSAKEQLHSLTGYGIDSVAGFERSDSGWHLAVTVVELRRIPAATDVLADYDVYLDEAGDIASYHRGKRYFRDQIGDGT